MTVDAWSQPCLVFDVGGTNLRAALYDSATNSLARHATRPTPNLHSMPNASQDAICDAMVSEMFDLGREVTSDLDVPTISVAFAGPLDPQNRVMSAPTIWGPRPAEPIDLLAKFAKYWPEARVLILNDVSAAGYRYLKDFSEDMCIITVSSGVGNKMFVNGRLVVGPHGRGGEIGHVRVDHNHDAPDCDCGGTGHLGGIASGRGTLAMAIRMARSNQQGFARSRLATLVGGKVAAISNPAIVRAFRLADPWTCYVVKTAARPLGQMLSSIHLGVGIERFVIFGGFALALGECYRSILVEWASECSWQMGQDWHKMIELGLPDDNSGLIGAGRFATVFHGRNDDEATGSGTIQLPGPTRRQVA